MTTNNTAAVQPSRNVALTHCEFTTTAPAVCTVHYVITAGQTHFGVQSYSAARLRSVLTGQIALLRCMQRLLESDTIQTTSQWLVNGKSGCVECQLYRM